MQFRYLDIIVSFSLLWYRYLIVLLREFAKEWGIDLNANISMLTWQCKSTESSWTQNIKQGG